MQIIPEEGVAIISAGGQGSSVIVDLGFRTDDQGRIATRGSESENIDSSSPHIVWGSADDFPVQLATDAELDTVIAPGLRLKTEMHFAGGVSHGVIQLQDDGEETFINKSIPEVRDFFRKNNISRQLYCTLYDLNMYSTAVVTFVLSNDRQKIVRYSCEMSRAKFCRLAPMDKYGWIPKVFVNKDFGTSQYDADKTVEFTNLPKFDAAQFIRDQKKQVFTYVTQLPDSGRDYYPVPDWNTARNSNWLKISKLIALFKTYMMENQMVIKYHFQVHPTYWPTRFGEDSWSSWTDAEKISNMKAELGAWESFFKGNSGAGNSLMTAFGTDHLNAANTYDMVKITEIGSKFTKDGTYIEDSKEASEHKISALGLHPDMVGNAPGSSLGSGSGSGNRNAFNQRTSMAKAIQDFALEPLYVVAEYNGWDTELEFRMRPSLITTLDTGAAATKPQAMP